jgi:hypothetical protein
MKDISIETLRDSFIYDAATGDIHWRNPEKHPSRKRGPLGYMQQGYVFITIGEVNISVHRVAWAMHYGKWSESTIDHRDRNRANNRIDNLRLATESQNHVNAQVRGAFPCKGVSFEKKRGKYRAQIKFARKGKHIGYYDTMDEAAHAYNKEAVVIHGEFALLNPIGADK